MADLRDSFNFFDSENSGQVTLAHLKAILQNFAQSNVTRKEISEEITNAIGGSRVADWNDLVAIMGKLTAGNHREIETKETWKVLDKRDRGVVSYQDFKTGL